jgi:hypothetical protein
LFSIFGKFVPALTFFICLVIIVVLFCCFDWCLKWCLHGVWMMNEWCLLSVFCCCHCTSTVILLRLAMFFMFFCCPYDVWMMSGWCLDDAWVMMSVWDQVDV